MAMTNLSFGEIPPELELLELDELLEEELLELDELDELEEELLELDELLELEDELLEDEVPPPVHPVSAEVIKAVNATAYRKVL